MLQPFKQKDAVIERESSSKHNIPKYTEAKIEHTHKPMFYSFKFYLRFRYSLSAQNFLVIRYYSLG